MRKTLRRIALVLIATAAASLAVVKPAFAVTCPGNVTDGQTACHLSSQSGNNGTYRCSNGNTYVWDCRGFFETP